MAEAENPIAPQPAIPPKELTKLKLLIGEGQEEVRFFGALLRHLTITDIQVEAYEGKSKLPDYLAALVLRPGFDDIRSLGVTRDADASASSTLTSVRDSLQKSGLVSPASSGTIEAGNPNVGILILPDGYSSGMLEDLCLAALHGDPVMECINEYLGCVQLQAGLNPNTISKARIHAWLAAQTKPDMRLGEAAEKGYVNWNNAAFDQIKLFLSLL